MPCARVATFTSTGVTVRFGALDFPWRGAGSYGAVPVPSWARRPGILSQGADGGRLAGRHGTCTSSIGVP
jgi:hypothetical protein